MIGRDQDISAIMRSIAGDAARGVALAGKAGVGKSRLAREAVAAAAAAGWTVRSIAATATSRPIPAATAAPSAPNPAETGCDGNGVWASAAALVSGPAIPL